ncbi:MAG: hypothetical protein GXO35_03510 [Gammaproteobacteria bacterium]|nr:hypothetical protein [Gammaproteobacteria bacterium]
MLKFKVVIPFVLGLFIWQGVAEAASISTRVRVLESKVSKQDKKIKLSERSRRAQEIKVDKSLAQVHALEKKVEGLLKAAKSSKKIKRRSTDKRYAFP